MVSRHADDQRMMAAEFIAEHLAYLGAIGVAETTRDAARELLLRAERELPRGVRSLPQEIVEWLDNDDWGPGTKMVYRAHLRRFYRWAVHGPNPCMSSDPTAGLPRPRVPTGEPHPADDDVVAAACTQAAEPYRLHCLLAGYGGLRCREIALLRREEVTVDDMTVHGKGGRVRVVPTDPYIWAAVKDLPPGPVTSRRNGAPPDAQWVSASTREHLHMVLGLRTSLHRFRSWYATKALDKCGDLLVVKELLGHASVATTQIYTRVNAVRRRAAVAGLPRLPVSVSSVDAVGGVMPAGGSLA